MDVPVSDELFHDDDLTTITARLENDQVGYINDYANEKETSFDQALRYLVNVAFQSLRAGEDEPAESSSGEDSVYARFRKLAKRINHLETKSKSIEEEDQAELLHRILERSEEAAGEHEPTEASGDAGSADSEASGPPSMFDIADDS